MNDVAEALNFTGLKSTGLIQDTYDNFIGGKCWASYVNWNVLNFSVTDRVSVCWTM